MTQTTETRPPMSDIESIRKFANGNSSLEDRGYEGRPMADGSYCYAKHPTSEFTCEHNARIEQLEEDVRTLLSALAITREEALDDCRNACLDIDLDSYRGHDRHTADEVMELVFSAIRSLSTTPQSTQKEKQP